MAVTLKEIAEAAGVSRATVDRVLHGRGHVKPDVEARIWQLAREMRYQPSPLGRGLVKSARATKIGVICQFRETPFMQMVVAGIEQVREELRLMGAELLLDTIDSYAPARMIASIDEMLQEGVQGLALTPGTTVDIRSKIKEVIAGGIPVITFNTDISGVGRLCYVGLDNVRAGQTCAGLMASSLRQGGLVLPISGYRGHSAHDQRLSGFQEIIRTTFPALRMLPVAWCHDSDRMAEEIVFETLQKYPNLSGVYISGNGQAGVCRALHRTGYAGKVVVICYDLTSENVAELQRGCIDFLIDQGAREQGYRPARLLYDYLILNTPPNRAFYYTDILIKTRYNLYSDPHDN